MFSSYLHVHYILQDPSLSPSLFVFHHQTLLTTTSSLSLHTLPRRKHPPITPSIPTVIIIVDEDRHFHPPRLCGCGLYRPRPPSPASFQVKHLVRLAKYQKPINSLLNVLVTHYSTAFVFVSLSNTALHLLSKQNRFLLPLHLILLHLIFLLLSRPHKILSTSGTILSRLRHQKLLKPRTRPCSGLSASASATAKISPRLIPQSPSTPLVFWMLLIDALT